MRNNSYISVSQVLRPMVLAWFLFVTTFVNVTNARTDESNLRSSEPIVVPKEDSKTFYYDSAIQRSNFITITPTYIDILEEQIKGRRSALLWKMRFDSQSLTTQDNIQSHNVGATVRGRLKYKLLDNLDFKAKANLSLESGRSQTIFGDLEPSSGIYPRELKIEYKPFGDYVALGFGQIHQRWLNEPLFVGNLGFPGAQQRFSFSNKKGFDIDLITQQLVPTSSTLGTRVTQREALPNLFTETLQSTYHISSSNFVFGRLTHYRYTQLPSIVAFNSYIYGNTVTNTDEKNAEFIYDFNGLNYQFGYEQKITDSFAAQIRYSAIKNDKAPAEAGEAQSIRLLLANDFGRWILAGYYVNFFIESDAVPAYYNSHRFGHNNRIGDAIELNLESKDWDVIFRASYTKADLLNATTPRIVDGLQQDDQQIIYFAVETTYDFI